jgi:hypothetical protein
MRELGTDMFFSFLLPHPAPAFFGTLRRCTKAAAGGESEVYVWSAPHRRRRSGVIVHQKEPDALTLPEMAPARRLLGVEVEPLYPAAQPRTDQIWLAAA